MAELDDRIRRYYAYHGVASFAIWIPFWTLWIRTHLETDFQLTLVDAVFWATMLVLQLPAGVISDKYSRKWSLFLGETCKFVGLLGYALGTTFLAYALANVVWAVGIVFLVSSDSSFLYDTLAEFGREDRFAAVKGRASLLDLVASAIGSLVGGFVVPALGGRLDLVIIVGAVIGMAGGTLTAVFRAPKFARPWERAGSEQVREGYRAVRTSPGLARIILFQVVLTTTFTSFSIFRSIYYTRVGIPESQLGLVWAGFLTVGGIAAAGSGWAARRLGEARSMAALTVLVGLPLIGVFLARDATPWVVALQVPMYIAFGLQTPLIATFINRRVDAARRATVLSLAAVVTVLALLFVEPAVGWLSATVDIYAIGLALGLMQLVLGTAIVLWWLVAAPAFVPPVAATGPSLWSRVAERFTRVRP